MTTLINAITGCEDDFVIVLDDYHSIESQPVHQAVTFMVEHLPPNAHMVIISRSDPPLPLSRWRVRGELAEIRAADLAFTVDEAAEFFGSAAGVALSQQDLSALESRTEGWIAGLKMAALSLQGKKDVSTFVKAFSGSHRYILDYLAEEVLNRQTEAVKRFLLDTSILERLSGPLCDAVTEQSQSESTLVQLESANLFISPLDDERRWYRYHPLFAAVLRNQLERQQAERVQLLHHRASMWCATAGLTEEAVNHAIWGGDAAHAAELIEDAAPAMLGNNRAAALLDYSTRLPESLTTASPWLSVCFAWAALITNQPDVLSAMLSRANMALAELPDVLSAYSRANMQRIKGHTLSIQSVVTQAQGDIPGAIQLAEEANQVLPSNRIDDLLARAVNSLNLSSWHGITGEIAKSVPFLEDLVDAGRKVGYRYAVVSSQGALAEIEMALSHLDRAAAICRETLEQGTRWGGSCPLPASALAYVVLGQLDYEQNDLDTAMSNLTRGIELGESGFNREAVLKGCLQMANLAQARGDSALADEYINRAENTGPWVYTPLEIQKIPAVRARMALRRGDLASASDWVRRQEAEMPLSQLPEYRQEFDYLTLARVKITTGECRELPEYLDIFAARAEAQERKSAVIEALVLKALALNCLGESAGALDTLDRALSLAESAGYVRTFIDENEPLASMIRKAIIGGKHAGYALRLLDEMRLSALPVASSDLVEDLSEREVEVLRLIAAGMSNKEIAEELVLAVGTVKKHTNNIFGKLDVESRTQAIARARELGII
jgi:LuxR family transcriptional regulator, maltose regulon positive regulatory protein